MSLNSELRSNRRKRHDKGEIEEVNLDLKQLINKGSRCVINPERKFNLKKKQFLGETKVKMDRDLA